MRTRKVSVKKVKHEAPFPVVAIGASAGGLDAFTALLKHLPDKTGMAYIYVQHLSRDHKSVLSSILSKLTKMPVQEIDDMEKMAPDNIYIIPNNKEIAVVDGHIKLSPRPKKSATNLSIDFLFTSLAETHKENVIGIVLSGYASDGTKGLKAIKEAGGMTFAQNTTATASSMPQSAIDAGVVDFVLSPKEIALALGKYSASGFVRLKIKKAPVVKMIEPSIPDLKNVFDVLHKKHGVDFSHYKMATIRRRLNHRMAQSGIKSLKEYSALLLNTNEVDLLYKDLLINVTSFFRDPEIFNYLKSTFLPKLIKSKKHDESLRIWVPACSTGEEAYSIAMLISEIQDKAKYKIPIQIFATDLSESAIRDARLSKYSQEDISEISPQRLKRFFTKTGDSYTVVKEIREMCVFAPHNILRDPPFFKMDLISCRNLLIYFDKAAQKQAFGIMHFALKEGGYLLLGKSETTGTSSPYFTQTSDKFKIYSRKKDSGMRKTPELLPHFSRANIYDKPSKSAPKKSTPGVALELDGVIDKLLLTSYMPACAIINKDMDILQFRGSTSLYLSHSSGKASLNILKMTRPEFAFELRNAIHTALKTQKSVKKTDIEMNPKIAGIDFLLMTLEVSPLKVEWEETLLIVVFTPQHQPDKLPGSENLDKNSSIHKDRKIKKLTEELNTVRAEMNSIIESQETAYEELQAANEEIVSTNEEFQTLNEELETSKEEIEATNEELISTNHELKVQNELLAESYNYSETIIATIHEPMIILDSSLHIKSANKSFYDKFMVSKTETEGMHLFELGNNQWDIPQLRTLLEDVFNRSSHFQNFEVTHVFPKLGEKIMLLNANRIIQKTHREKLVLLAIEDITNLKRLAIEIQEKEKNALETQLEIEKQALKKIVESEKRYHTILMQSPFAFSIMKGKDMVITMANDLMKGFWGKGNAIEGKKLLHALPELKNQLFPEMLQKVFTTGVPVSMSEIPARLKRNGKMEERYFDVVYQPYYEADNTISGVTTIAYDVTEQVEAHRRIEESEKKFRVLTNAVPQKITTADTDGNVTYFNQQWIEDTGFTFQELKGWGWEKAMHPDDREKTKKRWKESVETGKIFEMECRILNKNGGYKWHLSRAIPLRDDNGKIQMWVGSNTEIQQQKEEKEELEKGVKRRTRQLEQKNEQLESANKDLTTFTFVSSHDLQEPLRKIQNFSALILENEEKNLSDEGKGYFKRVQDTASRMQLLIDDLLIYSRTKSSDRKLEEIDLKSIFEDVKSNFQELMEQKHATMEIRSACKVKIIPFQFRQLFQNLVDNSLKFAKVGLPPIITMKSKIENGRKLKIEKLSAKKEYCHIVYTDNGIGFPPQYQEKIFEVFQRLHSVDKYQGTGIGLAICKRIVENHNGVITATGSLTKGARFDIYIPV